MKEDFIDYNIAGIRDLLNIMMDSVNILQREKMLSENGMEATETVKYALGLIARSLTMLDDLREMTYCPGYYSIKNYLETVCAGFRSVCKMFGAEIEVRICPEDDENIVFDGAAMEKIFYNCIHILIANCEYEKCKLTISVKNSLNTVTFCVKNNAPFVGNTTRKDIINNTQNIHNTLSNLDEAYLNKVAALMNGRVDFCSGKKSARFEICIPKNLKLGTTVMKEAETIFANNEYVMKYEANPRKYIGIFMAQMLHNQNKYIIKD